MSDDWLHLPPYDGTHRAPEPTPKPEPKETAVSDFVWKIIFWWRIDGAGISGPCGILNCTL